MRRCLTWFSFGFVIGVDIFMLTEFTVKIPMSGGFFAYLLRSHGHHRHRLSCPSSARMTVALIRMCGQGHNPLSWGGASMLSLSKQLSGAR
ncbi:hypothetical protein BDA96_07G113200 [Sorghum bicolor]|uniref:Uncharacterized protein n=2 Tax=Sorghum bicolor TaxID=4558 RepID=A0A921UA77_SORBI|nr:hypothetical protein BDA96_07G113200 [Sorghum bicolor]OQU80297.1 hypothetical protein SORBI_3007G106850 [Sorghum bicolor]